MKIVYKMAYELELLVELAIVHLVFHISLLKNCVGDPKFIVLLESVVVRNIINYEDIPVEDLDRQV